MTVTRVGRRRLAEVTGTGYRPEGEFRLDGVKVNPADYPAVMTSLWLGVLNNDAVLEPLSSNNGASEGGYRIVGDPTEGALLVAAAKAGGSAELLNQAYPRTDEIPFDSVRKRMLTIHNVSSPSSDDLSPFKEGENDRYVIAVKGAPDVVLGLCSHYQSLDDKQTLPLDDAARERILAANDSMTRDALRVLGVAYRVRGQRPARRSTPPSWSRIWSSSACWA